MVVGLIAAVLGVSLSAASAALAAPTSPAASAARAAPTSPAAPAPTARAAPAPTARAALAALTSPNVAQATPLGRLDVVQVNGLIDPIQVDFLRHAITAADRGSAVALVVQLDSGGGVVSAADLHRLTAAIAAAQVPVAVWVGPNGSRALGAAAVIFEAAPLRGMAPSTRVGHAPASDALSPTALSPTALSPTALSPTALSPTALSPAAPSSNAQSPTVQPANAQPGQDPLAGHIVNEAQAAAQGITTPTLDQPTLGDFIVNLDGQQLRDVTLHTAAVIKVNGQPRRQPNVAVRFEKLNLVQQLLHTAASPSVAYLMLLIGLLLIALEFFTAGVGIGAVCGTGALILASYGLGTLPIRVWALLLLGLAVFGFCVDLQSGVPRVWTALGGVCLLVGSLWLFRGVHPSLLALVAGILGTPLFMVAGMPAMIRARFSTPTIGRQSLVGEMGVALGPVEPEGTVEVRGAPWRARTNRATPIALGDPIRVVSIDGLLLEVEPETGGAKDAHH